MLGSSRDHCIDEQEGEMTIQLLVWTRSPRQDYSRIIMKVARLVQTPSVSIPLQQGAGTRFQIGFRDDGFLVEKSGKGVRPCRFYVGAVIQAKGRHEGHTRRNHGWGSCASLQARPHAGYTSWIASSPPFGSWPHLISLGSVNFRGFFRRLSLN